MTAPSSDAAAPHIPYGRQTIEAEDLAAVEAALRSSWLTTGPRVPEFEQAFARFCGAREAVAVNSGTAALHVAMRAAGVGAGDEVIGPALTFAASLNAAVYMGATPRFADVEADTLLIDPASVEALVTERTKAIVAVDYAGQPADYDALRRIAEPRGIALIADACHAPGALYRGRPVGTLADVSTFSFHPVKHLTTGEGGMAVTDDPGKAVLMRRFRNHGIDTDHRSRAEKGTFAYDMVELGYNYRLSDLNCALGLAQLTRLGAWVERRQALARLYDQAFAGMNHARPLAQRGDRTNAHHLYVVRLDPEGAIPRDEAFQRLRATGIGANVHYPPVHLHSFYRETFGTAEGLCPVAERAAGEILTLPIYPTMTEADLARVVEAVAGLARPGAAAAA